MRLSTTTTSRTWFRKPVLQPILGSVLSRPCPCRRLAGTITHSSSSPPPPQSLLSLLSPSRAVTSAKFSTTLSPHRGQPRKMADLSLDEDSVFSMGGEESDVFQPEVKKPKAKAVTKKTAAAKPPKAAAAKPAVKKMTQTTLTAKKRAKPEPDSEDDNGGDGDGDGDDAASIMSTPPSAKKQKKAAPKKTGGKPLVEIENDSMMMVDDMPKMSAKSKKTATEEYQKLTQLEHIIKRPDTYIGSVERTEQQMWVYNKETSEMEHRSVSYVPGLYKIFDEIIVNAADNKQKDPTGMTYLKVDINRAEGIISVENNGKAIPIEMHQKEKVYIPELVFGHLLAGSNFDDNEQKTVGGRNGYGAKLCNVFSTEFTVEMQDKEREKRYKQTWTDNMAKMLKPKITTNTSKDFVKVTFKPDFARFGMPDGIDDDLESLLHRRVHDMAGTVRGVKVHLNGTLLKIKDFEAYCQMYARAIAKERDVEEGGTAEAKVYLDKDKGHPRWEVAFAVSDGTFQQVSFVNSIATTSGGTHVSYVADQISQSLLKNLTKKVKGHSLKANHIRNHIFIFVNCLVNNPAFSSQTKEQMTTKASAFGSKCTLSEEFLKKIASSDALNNIISFAEKKADKLLAKSDGSKRSRINNAKLTEANLAGTKHGRECTLILTEGDSAKGLAIAGRAIHSPDKLGVFPLRGKMLNVRDANIDQISKNVEIQMIKQILGLKHKQNYEDAKGLRYGHLMIMADQDHDGSHIKGLLINFLQIQFPSLLQIPNFFLEFITPIVKVWKGPNPKQPQKLKYFFTQPEYETWKKSHERENWDTKYLKGLGTSSTDDTQRYFTNVDEHLKEFGVMKSEEAELFELAFSKKKADARKEWLGSFVPGTYLDHSTKLITYTDFINKELILFSMADNMRSIPSVLDGFKPGQRKVMYACFLRNLVKDMKVCELGGYVSQMTAYHHGDTSLQQTIIGLAQDFVGSNNVSVLEPSGNFGSRLQGGSDAASPRYIHTRLSPFARKVFPAADEPVLDWQWDEGKKIEPKNYAPIVPMVLVNGADGIGTGWSTSIPNYHPLDIVKNLKRRMGRLDPGDREEKPFEAMAPWFKGWRGTPEAAGPDRFKFNGIATPDENHPNEVIISELPIRMWTDDFKARLEEIISGVKGPSWIKDYREFNDHQTVHFEIILDEKHTKAVTDEGLVERFKLAKQVATSNLVAFDTRGQIRKYANVEDIMEEFYHYRLGMYTNRKAHRLGVLDDDFRKLQNQARFVKEIVDGVLIVGKKRKDVLVEELRERKYEAFPKDDAKGSKKDNDEEIQDEDGEDEQKGSARDYDYLLSMPIWSLTAERLEKLRDQILKKKAEYEDLKSKSEKDLWCYDLDQFAAEWDNQAEINSSIQKGIRRMGRRVSRKLGGSGKNRGGTAKVDEDYRPQKGGGAKAAAAAKPAAPKVIDTKPVETKTHQRFAEKFGGASKPKIKKEDSSADIDLSDDDFAALGRSKPINAAATEVADWSLPSPGRSKRAAAAKAKKYVVDDDEDEDVDEESNDDSLLGDVGAMVKGIGKSTGTDTSNGRLSLFAMSRPDGGKADGGSSAALPTVRPKPSKTFDFDSQDDTNYEMLAKSSPHKAATKEDTLSDDDDFDLPVAYKLQPAAAATAAKASTALSSAGSEAVAKKRSRTATTAAKTKSKTKTKEEAKPKAAAKALGQSPAAKAYAAKRSNRKVLSDDDDDDDEDEDKDEDDDLMDSPGSPPRRPVAGRGRPTRAAVVASKPKRYIMDDDESDSMLALERDDESDLFELDDE